MELCFATNNKHKLEEVRDAVGRNIRIISLQEINCTEELPETRDTFEGNSLQKAEYVRTHFNIACFADDSGLEVEALHLVEVGKRPELTNGRIDRRWRRMIPIDRIQHLTTVGFTGLFRDQPLFDLPFGFRPPLIELRF